MPSGKVYAGSLPLATTFKKNNGEPIDDRAAVLYKNNLIDRTVWIVDGADTRYNGMIVFVLRDDYTQYTDPNTGEAYSEPPVTPSSIPMLPTGQHLYILEDSDRSTWNTYSAWKLIGGGSGGADDTAGNTEVDFAEEEQVKKLFLIGAKEKGQQAGSYAVTYIGKQRTGNNNNDGNGAYTGDTYVDEHGWLHTANEPVAVKPDLLPIINAIQQWPDPQTHKGVCDDPPVFTITTADILQYAYLANNVDAVNNGAYVVGTNLTVKNNIVLNPDAVFSPLVDSDANFIFKNEIYDLSYGYEDSIGGTKHTDVQSLTSSITLRPQAISRTDLDRDPSTTLAMNFNNTNVITVNCNSQRPAGIEAPNLVIPAAQSVGSIVEGPNTIEIVYTNPSKMDVTGNTGTVPGIIAYHLSNLGNEDSNRVTTISDQSVTIRSQSDIYATDSINGVKTSQQLTVYGVHKIYSNGSVLADNLPTDPSDIQHEFHPNNMSNNASTNAVDSHNLEYIWNYYTDAEKYIYIKFGNISQLSTDRNARVFIPIISGKSLQVSSISEFNTQTGMFDNINGVRLNLLQDHVIIDNIEYNSYAILSNGGSFEGPNAYRITLTSNNE